MEKRKKWLPRSMADHRRYVGAEPMERTLDQRIIVLHNEGVDRPRHERLDDVTWLADFVNQAGIPYHCLWNPTTGQWIQMIPFHKAARSLKGGGMYGGASVNKAGRAVIQVCVTGFGYRPFTDLDTLKGVSVLAAIAKSWDVPLSFRTRWGPDANRNRNTWRHDGFHGHCHSPAVGENHLDPARIDYRKLKRALERA